MQPKLYHGKSVRDIARAARCDPGQASRILSGKRSARAELLARIATVLGVTMETLMAGMVPDAQEKQEGKAV